jgi:sugar lactone lactonase YvrE
MPAFVRICSGWYSRAATIMVGLALLVSSSLAQFYPLPSIITQPVSTSISIGETAVVFGVVASDFPIGDASYQWRKNGRAIAGATSHTLTIANAQPSDAGNYDVVVTGRYGSITSDRVTLTVVPPFAPSITSQPTDRVAVQGSSVTFTAGVSALPRPRFQWRKDGVNIGGATSSSLFLVNLIVADAGIYDVVATNNQGVAISRGASLTVTLPPITITLQPVGATVYLGDTVDLRVAATGDSTLRFQWRKNGVNLNGETQTTLTLRTVKFENSGDYDVVVYTYAGLSAGWIGSNVAALTVVVPPLGITPTSVSVQEGNPAAFYLFPQYLNLTCQWRKNGVAIAGATKAFYTVSGASSSDTGFYSIVVHGDDWTIESDAAVLLVRPDPYRFAILSGALRERGSTDGPAEHARFNIPWGIAIDIGGNVYVTDNGDGTVRKISPQGVATTFAGAAGQHGFVNGVGSAARFAFPTGVAVDEHGNVYVGDNGNGVVRKITSDGRVTTLGEGRAPRIGGVGGLTIDQAGQIYLADYVNHTLIKFNAAGAMSIFAGLSGVAGNADGVGTSARFNSPGAAAADASGNIFVSDDGNHSLRRVTPAGVVSTIAGASSSPTLAIDQENGILVVSDETLQRVSPSGGVTTLARPSTAYGSAGSNARFFPRGLAVGNADTLYIADTQVATVLKGAQVVSAPSRLSNLSTRATLPSGSALVLGFAMHGRGTKHLLARAVGPTLAHFGVAGALSDPGLEIVGLNALTPLLTNDDWGTNADQVGLIAATSAVGAFPLDSASKDAAVIMNVDTTSNNPCTVRITASRSAGSGVVLGELYDLDAAPTPASLSSISSLGFCGAGDNALVVGFTIAGAGPRKLLIRAIGPALVQFGVEPAVRDPRLAVFPLGLSTAVATNDNWDGATATTAAFARAGAFNLALGSRDAAVLCELPAGSYSVVVTGATTGLALVEVYDLER